MIKCDFVRSVTIFVLATCVHNAAAQSGEDNFGKLFGPDDFLALWANNITPESTMTLLDPTTAPVGKQGFVFDDDSDFWFVAMLSDNIDMADFEDFTEIIPDGVGKLHSPSLFHIPDDFLGTMSNVVEVGDAEYLLTERDIYFKGLLEGSTGAIIPLVGIISVVITETLEVEPVVVGFTAYCRPLWVFDSNDEAEIAFAAIVDIYLEDYEVVALGVPGPPNQDNIAAIVDFVDVLTVCLRSYNETIRDCLRDWGNDQDDCDSSMANDRRECFDDHEDTVAANELQLELLIADVSVWECTKDGAGTGAAILGPIGGLSGWVVGAVFGEELGGGTGAVIGGTVGVIVGGCYGGAAGALIGPAAQRHHIRRAHAILMEFANRTLTTCVRRAHRDHGTCSAIVIRSLVQCVESAGDAFNDCMNK